MISCPKIIEIPSSEPLRRAKDNLWLQNRGKEIIACRMKVSHCRDFGKANNISLSACFDSYRAYNTVTSF
jgi:hypothetical protein